jgi:hypothetical protein
MTQPNVTQFWQRRTNVWRRVTSPARGAKRLRSGSQELLWVDHRFAADLIDGLEAAGMEVRS